MTVTLTAVGWLRMTQASAECDFYVSNDVRLGAIRAGEAWGSGLAQTIVEPRYTARAPWIDWCEPRTSDQHGSVL